MSKINDERMQQIAQDSDALRQLLQTAVSGARRPAGLYGDVLKAALKTQQLRRGTFKMTPKIYALSACAAAGVVVASVLLSSGRLQMGFSVNDLMRKTAEQAAPAAEAQDAPTTASEDVNASESLALPDAPAPQSDAGAADAAAAAFKQAENYEEIAAALSPFSTEAASAPFLSGRTAPKGAGAALPESAKSFGPVGAPGSVTNLQTPGVDEADVIKTDGDYLYYIAHATENREETTLYIVEAQQLTLASSIPVSRGFTGELFVQGDTLAVLTNRQELPTAAYGAAAGENSAQSGSTSSLPAASSRAGDTHDTEKKMAETPGVVSSSCVELYDIADRTAPKHLRTFAQEGDYLTARLYENELVLISQRQPQRIWRNGAVPLTRQDAAAFVPKIYDSTAGQRTLPPSSVLLPEEPASPAFAVVSTLPLTGSGESVTKAVLGGAEFAYMTDENLYLAAMRPGEQYQTQLTKFSLQNSLTPTASRVLSGGVESQYSLSEDKKSGTLRVATTSYDKSGQPSNNLYILDEELAERSSLFDLAPGETIRAARYIGDMAYLVTFQETDPLFLIDLSDLDSPVVVGELKSPGFSEYLHPVTETTLVGLGHNVSLTESGGVAQEGLKLSLFDLSDPKNPRETDSLSIGGRGTISPALWDSRAFFFRQSDGLFGFPADIITPPAAGQSEGARSFSGFFLLQAKDGKFAPVARVSHYESLSGYSHLLHNVQRGVVLEQTLYTATEGELLATDLATGHQTARLSLT